MKFNQALRLIQKLGFDKPVVITHDTDITLFVLRPSKLPKRFKDYDVRKNFQIWFQEGEREFRPNHLRVMIDLNLRVRSRPDLKNELLLALDNTFYGSDPDQEIRRFSGEKFAHYLNSLKIIANLSQLFIIEQLYSYHKESKFDPPTLFYQGWIREFIDSPKEIDNLCMSVANGQPPLARYVDKENKKSKKYEARLPQLWYIND